jgi:ElaB/YqjD/DUF883 family membrane-anchored ribosome-binding protein
MSSVDQEGYNRLQKDVESVKSDISKLTAQISDSFGELTDNVRRQARHGMKRARANANSILADAGEQGSAALSAAQDAANTVEETLEDAILQRPLAAVGLAAALGFLIGVTWRR